MFRHDGIFELVVERAFSSGNWRGRAWSDGCSQDWIETHTEERSQVSLIYSSRPNAVSECLRSNPPHIGYDTFASVRGCRTSPTPHE